MKRIAVTVAAMAVLAFAAGFAFVSGAVPGVSGCTLRSVDKQHYVAENEAAFYTIRIPPLLTEANETSYSIGIPAQEACLPFENGPPYERYITWHVYTRDPGETRPLGFDRRALGGEWVSDSAVLSEEIFRRGRAALYVHFSDEAVSLGVDHRAR